MTDFILMYVGGDPDWPNWDPEKRERVGKQWVRWFEELESTGQLKSWASLEPSGASITRQGDRLITDMPGTETKEVIGGFTIVQAESLEAAVEIAKTAPFLQNNPTGRLAIRPLMPQ